MNKNEIMVFAIAVFGLLTMILLCYCLILHGKVKIIETNCNTLQVEVSRYSTQALNLSHEPCTVVYRKYKKKEPKVKKEKNND